jgi:glycosyltransferase involved in cell wall biosynthesis
MIQRPVLEQATCFHATGDAEYEDIRRMGFRQPVAVIPNGIDLPQIDSRAQKKAARTLLYLGRLHPIKGLDVLLRAWHKLQLIYPTWTLRLAGPDARGFLSQLRALERDLGLERVQFLGELNGAAKWDELRAAEIFVLPSYSENFGVAVAEALASGVPAVVSTAAPWQGLEGRGAGWWVEPTVQGVLSALHHAMKLSPEELRAMGTKGRTWMQEEFSWHFIGTRMNITYEWMDCGGTAPPWIRLN